MSFLRKGFFATILISATALSPATVSAETILGALAKAYQNRSTMNSARAGVRVTDEGVAIAKSGYRPNITASADINQSQTRTNSDIGNRTSNLTAGGFGIQINQMLFDGFQTKNTVAAAESRVLASNASLQNQEQNTLFDAASIYMDVIRDRQIAVLRERNLQFLSEQVRAARSRFEVGEGTRTDVAQAEATRSLAVAQLSSARAQAKSSEAIYRQYIGDAPTNLKAASPISKLLPRSLEAATAQASQQHPAIISTEYLVDVAGFNVKSAEGALLPQISATAGVNRSYREGSPDLTGQNGYSDTASIGATLSVPIYQGGRASAQVRQNKESLGQARIEVDVIRDQVLAQATSAWSLYVAAREGVAANRESVSAAQLALNGVIEERNVGQRTTLDVLNAQADVINAQINLASSERDVVVASYAILQSTGELSVRRLGLQVTEYKPEEHYNAVKDKWFGLRTPDGR
ncbi:TolC family outer membrane protein [Mesorhizobium sp. SB112]|uniref:TolC family outer membrane protein n=1 Tax=Mesorhizobium sp. SB112 TaxID=3151853 RepID=UPI0032636BA1